MRYNLEWDPQKARMNRQKHGISFEEAATVFRDPRMYTLYDADHSMAEEDRWITLGLSAVGRLLVVCHTFREETPTVTIIRIYSSRKATKYEIRQYEG